MSLKSFHIFFIAIAAIMSCAVGAWGLWQYSSGGATQLAALGAVSFAMAIVLVIYGIRFLRKLRHESFL